MHRWMTHTERPDLRPNYLIIRLGSGTQLTLGRKSTYEYLNLLPVELDICTLAHIQ